MPSNQNSQIMVLMGTTDSFLIKAFICLGTKKGEWRYWTTRIYADVWCEKKNTWKINASSWIKRTWPQWIYYLVKEGKKKKAHFLSKQSGYWHYTILLVLNRDRRGKPDSYSLGWRLEKWVLYVQLDIQKKKKKKLWEETWKHMEVWGAKKAKIGITRG